MLLTSITCMAKAFHIDTISIMMICLISFIGIHVALFSKRYMKGDALYGNFFWNLLILLLSVALMTIADNLFLFLISWSCCNWMLSRLMIHKSTWKAAQASGKIAIQNFILGSACIMLAFCLFYLATGSLSIQYIVHNLNDSWVAFIALILLLVGGMTQSAIWPFHRWLISSLNSPTPVSAIMHAGIINGGGFLLARFSPLYLNSPTILNIIFILGFISALLGSFWNLMQHDIKRMLACSTMGQMGFMIVQCGLGLFSLALAHLCWHGMFKAYLFLASGGAAQEKRQDLGYPPRLISFLFALVCGALGASIFVIINSKEWMPTDTTLIMVGVVFIAGSQLALTVLREAPLKRLLLAILLTATMAGLYAVNVYFFDLLLSPLKLMQPHPLNPLHWSGLVILTLAWLFILFVKHSGQETQLPDWVLRLYTKGLNASQPHPSTITTYRKGYDYV